MNLEETITDKKTRDFLNPEHHQTHDDDHNAWVTTEIERRLNKKKTENNESYRSLDNVMSDHGFHNAR